MSNHAANPSQVAAAASSTQLLAGTGGYRRTGATFYNKANTILRIGFSNPVTYANSVAALAAESSSIGGYYELPYGYNGPVYGIWDGSPTGQVNVTEVI